ncbi:MAG: methyl-accepting chemotaxis protein [Sterolibacterium sp.]
MPHWNTIKGKLIVVLLVSLVGMLIASVFSVYSEKATLLEDRKVKTRNLVEATSGVLSRFHALQIAGTMTEEEAKAAAISTIKGMRYDKNEYFWINDLTPTMIMHPIKPELDGKNLSNNKDPEGKFLFMEFVAEVKKNKAGFVDYLWPKPGFDRPVPKISYVAGFEPWGWILGSGIYLDDVEQIFRTRALTVLSINLAIMLVMGGLIFMLVRSIASPIQEIMGAMQSIQVTKDLSRRVQIAGNNEITEIGRSFNAMVESFQELIRHVISNSREVMALTSKLALAASHVAITSSQQREASASMAAAMEQTKASIEQVANNSSDAQQMAEQASSLSQEGEKIVESASNEMGLIATSVRESALQIESLGEKSDQISNIANVIKEIADQTNLLALNAAIEAARAGEQGRGFAVVADEVRKLAERTTKSTMEITGMIAGIQGGTAEAVRCMQEGSSRVQGGVSLANQAGDSMGLIREGAGRVIAAVSEINLALQEQSLATQHVVESTEKIVIMAEQNSAETGEIASTAESLENLSRKLQDTVDAFMV